MGYTTEFDGEIKITPKPTDEQRYFIESMFGDMREWNPEKSIELDFTHFDFEFNEDGNAIEWNGAEKFYNAIEKTQYLINETIKKFPKLKFNGTMNAQGEETNDAWVLIVKNNKVTRKERILIEKGKKCPKCNHKIT